LSLRRFLLVVSIGCAFAAALMVLATVLDAPVLYVPALFAILAVFAAREAWIWQGDGRGLLAMIGVLIGVGVIAFVLQRAAG
jgi:hypothetical protein